MSRVLPHPTLARVSGSVATLLAAKRVLEQARECTRHHPELRARCERALVHLTRAVRALGGEDKETSP